MAGASLTVSLDKLAVERHLKALQRRLGNLRDVFDEIGSSLVTSTNKRFEDQAGPDGKGWEKHSATTLLLRAQGGLRGKKRVFTKNGGLTYSARKTIDAAKLLQLTGALRKSITHRPSATQVQVGSDRKYAAMQQFGGRVAGAIKGEIPARPYLGLSDADRNSILVIVTNALERP